MERRVHQMPSHIARTSATGSLRGASAGRYRLVPAPYMQLPDAPQRDRSAAPHQLLCRGSAAAAPPADRHRPDNSDFGSLGQHSSDSARNALAPLTAHRHRAGVPDPAALDLNLCVTSKVAMALGLTLSLRRGNAYAAFRQRHGQGLTPAALAVRCGRNFQRCQQARQVGCFGHMQVETRSAGLLHECRVHERRERHQPRRPTLQAAHPGRDFEPVHVRHANVEKDDIGRQPDHSRDRVSAAADGSDLMPPGGEHFDQQVDDILAVIDD